MSKETTNRVGPVIFADEDARAHLEEYGTVISFRTSDRTTGETHVRYERTGKKQYDCGIELVEHVTDPGVLGGRIDEFYRMAGFDSAEAWREAIRSFHGEVPDEGYFYRVNAWQLIEAPEA